MPVVVQSTSTSPNKATVLWNQYGTVNNVTASSSAAGFPAVNLVDGSTANSWKAGAADATVTFDYGTARAIDSIGICGHNMFSSGVTQIAISSSSDGSTFTQAISYNVLSDEDLLILIGEVSARYWQLSLTGPAANISILTIGKKLAFPHSPVNTYVPLHHARTYTKFFNDSIRGQFINNRVMAAGAETSVDLGFVPRAFVDGDLRPFEAHYNQGGYFFYAGYPTTMPMDIGYCRAAGDEESVAVEYIEAGKLANLSFNVRSYVSAQ